MLLLATITTSTTPFNLKAGCAFDLCMVYMNTSSDSEVDAYLISDVVPTVQAFDPSCKLCKKKIIPEIVMHCYVSLCHIMPKCLFQIYFPCNCIELSSFITSEIVLNAEVLA